MTDWKGNPIIPGQTVVRVRIKPQSFIVPGQTIGVFISGIWIGLRQPPLQESKPKFIWEPLDEFEVMEYHGNYYSKYVFDGVTYCFLLDEEEENPLTIPTDEIIICIKGISDNETEFYLDYFK